MARIRQTITFTAPQMKWLKAESKRLGITIADVLRRMIDEYRRVRGDFRG